VEHSSSPQLAGVSLAKTTLFAGVIERAERLARRKRRRRIAANEQGDIIK
jgi:hypothetical protein